MSIYNRVKELCQQRGITLHVLETKIGLSVGATSKWRNGNPSADALIKVADFFGVSVDFLLGHECAKEENSVNVDAVAKIMERPAIVELLLNALALSDDNFYRLVEISKLLK